MGEVLGTWKQATANPEVFFFFFLRIRIMISAVYALVLDKDLK